MSEQENVGPFRVEPSLGLMGFKVVDVRDKTVIAIFTKEIDANEYADEKNTDLVVAEFFSNLERVPLSKDEMDDLKYRNRCERLYKFLKPQVAPDDTVGNKPTPKQIIATECRLILGAIYGSFENAIKAWMEERSSPFDKKE